MSNPASQVKMEREEQRIPDALTEEELDRLLEHVPYYLISLVIFAVDTGMRRAEIVRLIWSNVDFDQVQVTVRKSKADEFRVIPMTDRVRESLLRLKADNSRSVTPALLVFPFDGNSVNLILRSAAKEANVASDVWMHVFRHTFANRLRDRGVPLDRIKKVGGKTMRMVERYAKMSNPQLRAAISALNV